MDARAKPSICDLIVLFFLLSAMGYLAETMLFFLHFHALCERGFLSLPLLPIYGSSALLVYCLFGLPARGAKGFALYAAKAGLSVSAVEYAAGPYTFSSAFGSGITATSPSIWEGMSRSDRLRSGACCARSFSALRLCRSATPSEPFPAPFARRSRSR